jgi:transposase-like protein
MVTHVFHCPNCQQAEPVVRFGANRSGTRRLWCKVCRKVFTPQPRDRSVTPEKEESIAAALTERLSQRAVARLLQVSRDTICRPLKKKRKTPG